MNNKKNKALIIGGNGFIGFNLAKKLKKEKWNVTVVDIKEAPFGKSPADKVIIADASKWIMNDYYERIYQFAADMGGAGFIFTGDNDSDVMSNSASININILRQVKEIGCGTIFYSSSACVYSPEAAANRATEESAYPINPDSLYGLEKMFSENLFLAYAKNYGVNVRIARFNNTYGPYSTYKGGREKSPAAICRKVVESRIHGGPIEIWGDGQQVREFVYIDDLLDAIEVIMKSKVNTPINIGPEENITIDGLVRILSDKEIVHVPGPVGLQVRLTSYDKIQALGWKPKVSIEKGLKKTYKWIDQQYQS